MSSLNIASRAPSCPIKFLCLTMIREPENLQLYGLAIFALQTAFYHLYKGCSLAFVTTETLRETLRVWEYFERKNIREV